VAICSWLAAHEARSLRASDVGVSLAAVQAWKGMDGKQGGDPAKLADALVQLAVLEEPSVRFAAGADAVDTFQQKAGELLAQAAAHRELSLSLAHDD